jgi:kynurenine formamidase
MTTTAAASGPTRSQRGTTLVDLTLEIENGMPAHALFPSPIFLPYVDHEQAKSAGLGTEEDPFTYSINYLATLEHVGTHVDAPLHIKDGGDPVDRIPLDWFSGKAVCLDLRHIPDLGTIDVSELERAEEQAGVRVDGHIVLICTGLHERHYPNREVVTSNAGITGEATHWLADRGSRVHGVEGPSTDKAGTKEFPNHRVCRDRGLIHYEWLVNLEQLIGKGEFWFTGYPLKIKGGTGSPVRAVAELDA